MVLQCVKLDPQQIKLVSSAGLLNVLYVIKCCPVKKKTELRRKGGKHCYQRYVKQM